jgi:prophage tail gpP-like protein
MPFPWMIALKFIPWGDVIEHAPKVLNAARNLLDKKPHANNADDPVPGREVLDAQSATPPSLGEFKNRLIIAQHQIDHQAQVQEKMAQTLTELAEQNARLVGAVAVLRTRTRMLLWGMGALLVGLVGMVISGLLR